MYFNYIRVFHALPNIPMIDIYLNNNPVITGLEYKRLSQFIPVHSGNCNVKIYHAEQHKSLSNQNITVLPRSALTLAVIGVIPTISISSIPDPLLLTPLANKSYVRFIHISPNAPALDLTLADGTILFNDVEYTVQTKYIRVEPGSYRFHVRPSGGNQILSSIPSTSLKPGIIYTIYAVGLVGDSPLLEAIITEFENHQ